MHKEIRCEDMLLSLRATVCGMLVRLNRCLSSLGMMTLVGLYLVLTQPWPALLKIGEHLRFPWLAFACVPPPFARFGVAAGREYGWIGPPDGHTRG